MHFTIIFCFFNLHHWQPMHAPHLLERYDYIGVNGVRVCNHCGKVQIHQSFMHNSWWVDVPGNVERDDP